MRSFRAEWCEKYSWLHYDNSTDAAYCYICMKAELGNKFLASTKRDPAFISKGFKNWKDATIAFNAHLRSDCHKEGCEILELRSTTNDVAENLSNMYKEENELNRMMLIKILQNVRFLARQGLSLRGHKDDEDSNFTQLLLLRSIGCPEVLTWMKKKPNKYTSGDIQNEFFQVMALHNLRNICSDIVKNAVTGISQRYNQPGYSIYKNLENLLVYAANRNPFDEQLCAVLSHYGDDLASCQLSAQLQIWGAYFAEHCEPVSLRDCIQALQKMSATEKELLSEVCKLARLILVMPATNASSERSFSSMRRLKTYLRNTMCQSRLNHVMLLHIHQEKLDALSMDDIAEEFIQGNDHRLRLFGRI
ncbi:hypothetical protein EMCRGX_G021530 [Ephydatia muelleri]